MITVLSEADIAAIALPQDIIRTAVEAGLQAQSEGRALAEPTSVFNPVPGRDDLIAVIRGALPDQRLALVKTVGGFPGNAAKGRVTNPGCLTLIETETGQITGLLAAARITTERTAMVTAIGAHCLARHGARVLGVMGTGGIAVAAARYIAQAMPMSEIRLHGRDPARSADVASTLSAELGVPVITSPDWATCIGGADIVIDGTALPRDIPLFPAEAISAGALVIVFGAYSSLPVDIMDHTDRVVMDRWVADGRGALGPQISTGEVTEARLDALIGDVIGGRAAPRATDMDRIIFCHRGVAACDLALANAYLDVARERNLGTQILF
ncbi:MAG: hypothetical protein AAF367_06575 [Pseudomonadota bacterium]